MIKKIFLITKGENIIRRAEVLFLFNDFSTFIGWMLFSAYNTILHDQTFGKLERYQFLLFYLGGAVLSLSVSVTDLVGTITPKNEKSCIMNIKEYNFVVTEEYVGQRLDAFWYAKTFLSRSHIKNFIFYFILIKRW